MEAAVRVEFALEVLFFVVPMSHGRWGLSSVCYGKTRCG